MDTDERGYFTTMKNNLFLLIICSMLIGWQTFADDLATNDWGQVTNNAQMSINLKDGKNEIKTNHPVKLLIQIKNVSTNETFLVGRANAIENDESFSFVVIAPSGKNISPKPKNIPGSGGADPAIPNQIIKLEFNLSNLCKFDEVGTYKIIANKSLWSPERNKLFTVVSNPLYIAIIPDK